MTYPDEGVTAPAQRYGLVRKVLPKWSQPLLRGINRRWRRRNLRLEKPFFEVYPFTQVEVERLYHLVELTKIIDAKGVQGDIVECGVLDGGSAALLANSTSDSSRKVHLFDAWQGLPASSPQDGEAALKWVGDIVGSPRRVKRIMKKLNIHPSRVEFHKGWFVDTFPTSTIEQIALLHIDCDFYEPTWLSLETWYPNLAPGGFIQIDDYSSYQGSKTAVDEFVSAHPELTLLRRGTVHPAYYVEKPDVQ